MTLRPVAVCALIGIVSVLGYRLGEWGPDVLPSWTTPWIDNAPTPVVPEGQAPPAPTDWGTGPFVVSTGDITTEPPNLSCCADDPPAGSAPTLPNEYDGPWLHDYGLESCAAAGGVWTTTATDEQIPTVEGGTVRVLTVCTKCGLMGDCDKALLPGKPPPRKAKHGRLSAAGG